METFSRVPCKQRLPTWAHARYSLVEKGPVALNYVVSQNVRPGTHIIVGIGNDNWSMILVMFQLKFQTVSERDALFRNRFFPETTQNVSKTRFI